MIAGGGVDTSYNPAGGGALRSPMVRLADPVVGTLAPGVVAQKTRQMTLNEVQEPPTTVDGVDFEGGPEEVLVNNTLWSLIQASRGRFAGASQYKEAEGGETKGFIPESN